jgi:ribosome recycling factor
VIQEVKVVSQKALDEIKRARHLKHDQLRKLKGDKSLRSDDYQKAHDQMEKVVKKGNEEIKRISDGARRVFEG